MIYLTPSHLLEYLYCKRFTYFEYALDIPEHQEKRFKVQKGRDIHEHQQKINQKYLRKKLGVIKKEQEVELKSNTFNIKGKVDELLWLEDGNMSSFDYKYAEYKERLWKTTKIQAVMYAIMIQDVFYYNYKLVPKQVSKAYICFIRSNYKVIEIGFTEKDFIESKKHIDNCLEIIQIGFYPEGTNNKKKCSDCTYKNLCIH